MFLSNLKEAQALLSKYLPKTGTYYSSKRNYAYDFENKVHSTSMLSPYIRYRLISEEDIIKKVLAIHPFLKVEKFIQEIFWRTYWKGWLEHREEVYDDYLSEKHFLLQEYNINTEYQKVINGETKIDFFNNWVSNLKEDGYLHNHVRMWFASIWIFTFNLPWQLGANFFMENLLDVDPASNTLSWRWVAGLQTKGKHYLARKDNISKFSNINISSKIFINENPFINEGSAFKIKDNVLSSFITSIKDKIKELTKKKEIEYPSKFTRFWHTDRIMTEKIENYSTLIEKFGSLLQEIKGGKSIKLSKINNNLITSFEQIDEIIGKMQPPVLINFKKIY